MSLSVDDDVQGVDVQGVDVHSVDVHGVEVRRGVFTAGFLVGLFRVLGVIAFFGGAAVTGTMVWFAASTGLDMWGWIGTITGAVVGVFFTFFWCGFLLLFAAIADYIDKRTQLHAVDWR